MNRQKLALILAGLLLLVLATACGLNASVTDNQQATAEAITQSIILTATAAAVDVVAPEQALATVEVAATQERVSAAATQEVAATAVAVEVAATAESLTPIQEELASVGLDPNVGELGWVHEPITLTVEGYMQHGYANEFLATVAQDFVMAADITWNTRFGTTGCGFVVRSDGNEEAFNQYLVIATRGASGHVGFITQREGEVIKNESVDIYANGIDPLFEWQNDTTNRLLVIGQGDHFTIYTNGTLIDEIDAVAGYDKGFNAFVALNESGDTNCYFHNAWLWLLN